MFGKIVKYSWRDSAIFGGALLIGIGIASTFKGVSYKWSWDFFNPIFDIATLVAAVLIWYNEKKQDYVNALPKRLTVIFLYPKNTGDSNKRRRIAFLCEKASLAGEDDIRQWSQQLGSQMTGTNKFLKFTPSIYQFVCGKDDVDVLGNPIRHYINVIELTSIADLQNANETLEGKKEEASPAVKTALSLKNTVHWFEEQKDGAIELGRDFTKKWDYVADKGSWEVAPLQK